MNRKKSKLANRSKSKLILAPSGRGKKLATSTLPFKTVLKSSALKGKPRRASRQTPVAKPPPTSAVSQIKPKPTQELLFPKQSPPLTTTAASLTARTRGKVKQTATAAPPAMPAIVPKMRKKRTPEPVLPMSKGPRPPQKSPRLKKTALSTQGAAVKKRGTTGVQKGTAAAATKRPSKPARKQPLLLTKETSGPQTGFALTATKEPPLTPAEKFDLDTSSAKPLIEPVKSSVPSQFLRTPEPPLSLAGIPPILLEGDEPSDTHLSGPGMKYAVAPTLKEHTPAFRPPEALPLKTREPLLYLTPRDPWCLYAHWDLAPEEQLRYNALSAHHHLVLRVKPHLAAGETKELELHPESRHWFVHIERPGTSFIAELGYYTNQGIWTPLAKSSPAATPLDRAAEERQVVFAIAPVLRASKQVEAPRSQDQPTIPEAPRFAFNGPQLQTPPTMEPKLALVAERSLKAEPPIESAPPEKAAPPVFASRFQTPAFARPRMPLEFSEPPFNRLFASAPFMTPEQSRISEALFTEIIRSVRMVSHGLVTSPMLEELLEEKREARPDVPALPLPLVELPSSLPEQPPAGEVPTSPGGPEVVPGEKGKSFWFKVNAELIIYGATEPTASVLIGARTIRLREDGTFSYRFALPDGNYELPIRAISADGDDERAAAMKFSRETLARGEVGVHPQDQALKTAVLENVH